MVESYRYTLSLKNSRRVAINVSSRSISRWRLITFSCERSDGYRSTTARRERTAALVASDVAACAGREASGE